MNSSASPCDIAEALRAEAAALGFARIGFAEAESVDAPAVAVYERMIAEGRHAGMRYLERYGDLRADPRLLLEGARTVVSCAVAYPEPPGQPGGTLKFASYALGSDYHEAVRTMLFGLAARIVDLTGGDVRVCVDTAPLRERYWAVRAGLGFIGINNQLIIPGLGSRFFLGEIITTAHIAADEPCKLSCGGCLACVKACPGKALDGKGGMDCHRCNSYLTIEHRDELPAELRLHDRRVYGCDICQDVCPHNRVPSGSHDAMVPEALRPRPEMLTLTADAVESMTKGDYRRLSRHSAINRITLENLKRNIAKLQK